MTLPEVLIALGLLLGGAWIWWLYRLENTLKAYRGDGRVSLTRSLLPWQVNYSVDLPLKGPVNDVPLRFSLEGLPARRIYSVALVIPAPKEIPPWHIKPFRLRLDNHEQPKAAADAASLPLAGRYRNGCNLFYFPAQASFRVTRGDRWALQLSCSPELPQLDDGAVSLLITSAPIG